MSQELLVTLIAVGLLLLLVLKFRMHASPALLLVSLFAALGGGMGVEGLVATIQKGMGGTLGFIAVVIGLGSIFGALLEASGGVGAIGRLFLEKAGEKGGRYAMGLVGLIVAIPVFFDVALIILLPMVVSLAKRAGKPALWFGLPLLAGLATAHAFVPPTPGPVAVANLLGADLGLVILFGVLAGAPAMLLAGPFLVPLVDRLGALGPSIQTNEDDQQQSGSAGGALLVILVPVLLIVLSALAKSLLEAGVLLDAISFAGHPFVALLVGCGLAWVLAKKSAGVDISAAVGKSLEPAGAVILVTGAGGAFKQVLVDTGAGAALAESALGLGLTPLVAGFGLALMVRVAQGSATVAMITAAGLVAPIAESVGLAGAGLALVVIAIAAGATAFSHVNDSGFWLVNRYFGQTTAETLKSWTLCSAIVGFVGFGVAALLMMFVG